MKEKWERWEPIKGLADKYYIDKVDDGIYEFIINLKDQQRHHNLKVIFESPLDSYQRTDETYRYKKTIELKEKYGINFLGDWTFFKVTNSEYIKWLSHQSCGMSDQRNLKHFVFLAADSQLDIINISDPIKFEFSEYS